MERETFRSHTFFASMNSIATSRVHEYRNTTYRATRFSFLTTDSQTLWFLFSHFLPLVLTILCSRNVVKLFVWIAMNGFNFIKMASHRKNKSWIKLCSKSNGNSTFDSCNILGRWSPIGIRVINFNFRVTHFSIFSEIFALLSAHHYFTFYSVVRKFIVFLSVSLTCPTQNDRNGHCGMLKLHRHRSVNAHNIIAFAITWISCILSNTHIHSVIQPYT